MTLTGKTEEFEEKETIECRYGHPETVLRLTWARMPDSAVKGRRLSI
jgi:hypothetical protein